MIKYIIILKTYFRLAYKVYWLNRKYTNNLFKELKLQKLLKHPLSKEQCRRIFFYTTQSCITASWICALRGKGLTKNELRNVIYIGAITPILDDLTDNLKLTSREILDILKNKSNQEPGEEFVIANYLYQQLISTRNENFDKVFEDTLIAQDASLQQIEERNISDDALRTIASNKGGLAVLLYRTVLETPLKSSEKEALMTLGYILQQINDMFDIYKDHVNKQQTLFTNTDDINKNDLDYQLNIRKLISQFYMLDFKEKNIRKCLTEISTITSRGEVCLNQLKKLQGNTQKFDLTNYSRKQLICDMEKAGNIKKSLSYSVQFIDTIKAVNKKQTI